MTFVQQTERNSFSIGRLYATNAAGQRFKYADLKKCDVDIKTDLKDYFSEGTFAVGLAQSHSTVDISIEQYRIRPELIALQYGFAAPIASVEVPVQDEEGAIGTPTIDQYTLVNAATYIVGSETVYVTHTGTNGNQYDVFYERTTGSPVAGVSYSIAAGVLSFAAADNALPVKVDYKYGNTTGTLLQMKNVPQNSGSFFVLEVSKRDISPVDGSAGYFVAKFRSTKAAGLTLPGAEGEWNTFKSTAKAIADSAGICCDLTFVNLEA